VSTTAAQLSHSEKKLVLQQIVKKYQSKLEQIHGWIENKNGEGHDFLGWREWPTKEFLANDLKNMKAKKSEWMNKKIDTVVAIGIGGSYIGTMAAINMCNKPFAKKDIDVIYTTSLTADYIEGLLTYLKDKNWGIVVISKSGGTLEPALIFRLFRKALYQAYDKKEAASRIVAVTDKARGTLKTLSDLNGYTTFTSPDDIGGCSQCDGQTHCQLSQNV